MKFRRLIQSVTETWPKAFRTRKSILFAKCYPDVVKTRIFMHFQRILIEDFRGFWLISRFSTHFEHRFERFQVAQCFQMHSFSCIFYGSEQFSGQNPWNFDAWCKVLPGRDQERFQTVLVDQGFSRIFVDFAIFNSLWTSFWKLPGRAMPSNASIILYFFRFEQFSWAPVQCFFDKYAGFGSLLMYISIFSCFSTFW